MSLHSFIYKIALPPVWKIGAGIYHYYLKKKYLRGKRPVIHAETSKAKPRRIKERFFEKYIQGKALDIGYGGDLVAPNADGYDFEHGDAQYLNKVKDEQYDFVYSSHTLEHLPDPGAALKKLVQGFKKRRVFNFIYPA